MVDKYFGNDKANATAAVLLAKVDAWSNNIESSGYLSKLRSCWAAYHGAYYDRTGASHQITFSGEQSELVNLPVNHLRNLAQHILIMTTSSRPIMEARAINTDYKSLIQTLLANGILDYYMREKRLEKYLKVAVEYAVVMGSGYIKMEWNATSGEIYDYIEETKTPIYEGDVEFSNFSPFDIVMDGTKENQDHDWYCIRTYKNKYDLSAKYPELKDKIEGMQTKSDVQRFRLGVTDLTAETADVQVFEFYHRRTECMPDGRYMLFLSEDIILQDVPMPYRVLPIFRIAPSDILGTPYGYTPIFDILPLQEGMNSLYSTILTNQNAFGVQNIWVPRGLDIAVNQLAGSLNIIEGNAAAGKPEPLNLTQTPAEVFKFLEILERSAETLSGVNSVARGNPEASLKSGAALALVQSMAIQFMSGLQQSYVQLIEDVGTALIKILQDFANTPRLIAIAGKSNRTYMKEFASKDIEAISRVVVDVGNPLSRTTAGRVQMADQLLQYQMLKDPQQYLTVINTGRLDVATEDTQHELFLIREENENLIDGEQPIVVFFDQHSEHIKGHKAVLSDPDLRKDPGLVQRVLQHVQEHIQQLQQVDPNLLTAIGEQPIQPPAPPQAPPSPPSPQGVPGPAGNMMAPPQQGQQGMQINPSTQPGAQQINGPNLPPEGVNLPKVPQVPAQLLPNPQAMPPGSTKQ